MDEQVFGFLSGAEKGLFITNAYVIPADQALEVIQALYDRGVDVRILTNSLASHDVPAVNGRYKEWRDDLVSAGVELFEFRADPEVQAIVDIAPVESKFTGRHTKAVVWDREWVLSAQEF